MPNLNLSALEAVARGQLKTIETIAGYLRRQDWAHHLSGAESELRQTILALIAELRAAKEWRPIETAPKDGTQFLGAWGNHDEVHVVYIRDGECQRAMDHGQAWMMPTHWLPLPLPPGATP